MHFHHGWLAVLLQDFSIRNPSWYILHTIWGITHCWVPKGKAIWQLAFQLLRLPIGRDTHNFYLYFIARETMLCNPLYGWNKIFKFSSQMNTQVQKPMNCMISKFICNSRLLWIQTNLLTQRLAKKSIYLNDSYQLLFHQVVILEIRTRMSLNSYE